MTRSPDHQVNLRDIARECGVTTMTVSRALRNDPCQTPATNARIREVAARLGYRATHSAAGRRLISARHGGRVLNKVIALYFQPHFTQTRYFSTIFQGVHEALTQRGYTALICSNMDPVTYREPGEIPPIVERGEVDGIIASHLFDGTLARLRALPDAETRPMVYLYRHDPDAAVVTFDDEDGAAQATRHLLELGHRHFLYLGFLDAVQPLYKMLGMQRALREAGLPPERHLLAYHVDSYWAAPGMANMNVGWSDQDRRAEVSLPGDRDFLRFLPAHPEITALLCMNDSAAVRAWHFARFLGYHVPRDLSIVGCDDTDPMLDADGAPLLASIRVPLQEMGAEAAELIVKLVHQEPVAQRQIILPVSLVVRASTGPARGGDW